MILNRTLKQSNSTGIQVHNERIPSGVYTALQNANITDSVLNSYNDVNLRWIAKDKWKYSVNFGGKLKHANLAVINTSDQLIFFHRRSF